MNPRHIILPSVFPAFVLTVGCASDGSRPTNERHATLVSQEQTRHLVLTYRRQATDLRELVQGESILHQSDPLLVQAKALWASAQDAEDRAREYQQQVPHGQVQ